MVTANQVSMLAGEQLLDILEGLSQDHGEELTTAAARILLTQGLGLTSQQISEQYGSGREKVDFAASYVNENFLLNRQHPNILFELKRPDRKFVFGSRSYFKDVDQLKRYMMSKPCQTVEHGVIFNISQFQIFRRHNNLIYPVTQIIDLKKSLESNQFETRDEKIKHIDEIVAYLRKILIEEPQKSRRGTVITIWNNKGGVGKTTIAYFLSFLLSDSSNGHVQSESTRVLAIDFDHNQGDLTKNFLTKDSKCDLSEHRGKMLNLLEATRVGNRFDQYILKQSIIPISTNSARHKNVSIDLLAADQSLCDEKLGRMYSEQFTEDDNLILRRLCTDLVRYYDYIIIDAPPNYQQNVYAREAVNAADCLLPVALWGGRNSVENYYSVICDLLPRSRSIRGDGGPENLGLWINCYRRSSEDATKRKTLDHIYKLIDNASDDKKEELRRAFFLDRKENLRLIGEAAAIRSANYVDPRKSNFRVPWQKRPQDIYCNLLTSIIGEGK